MYCSNGVINAFILGIQQIYKERETDVEIIYAETKAQTETAVNTLEGKGCDVIFSYQSNDYCMYYCDSIGMKSIGFTKRYGLFGSEIRACRVLSQLGYVYHGHGENLHKR